MPSSFDRALAERLAALDADALLRTPTVLTGPGARARLPDGREVVSFCSNDYLGLARHPALAAAAAEAAVDLGVGTGASRLVSGTMPVHREAEAQLAQLVRRPAALLFSSAFAANVGTLPALFGAGDLVISDALNHASIVDGCRAARAQVEVVPHLRLDAVRDTLGRLRPARNTDPRPRHKCTGGTSTVNAAFQKTCPTRPAALNCCRLDEPTVAAAVAESDS